MTRDEEMAELRTLPGWSELTEEEITSRYIITGPDKMRYIVFDKAHSPETIKWAHELLRIIFKDGL